MRHRLARVIAAALLAAPIIVHAGPLLEGSLGLASEVEPASRRQALNAMMTPGWRFADLVAVELGVLVPLQDVANAQADVELRPMVVISPPFSPLYLRGIFTVTGIVKGPRDRGGGAALGAAFRLLGAKVFVEADALAIRASEGNPEQPQPTRWVVGGRLGGSYDF
jgi:hypothetical protein